MKKTGENEEAGNIENHFELDRLRSYWLAYYRRRRKGENTKKTERGRPMRVVAYR